MGFLVFLVLYFIAGAAILKCFFKSELEGEKDLLYMVMLWPVFLGVYGYVYVEEKLQDWFKQ